MAVRLSDGAITPHAHYGHYSDRNASVQRPVSLSIQFSVLCSAISKMADIHGHRMTELALICLPYPYTRDCSNQGEDCAGGVLKEGRKWEMGCGA